MEGQRTDCDSEATTRAFKRPFTTASFVEPLYVSYWQQPCPTHGPIGPPNGGSIRQESSSRSVKKGTKLHFKSPTAERAHVLCVGVGRD